MANSMAADVHRSTTWSIVLSVLMIAAGVLAIFVPVIAGVAVTALVGWLLIFSGLLHLAFAWRGGRASAVLWEILLGVVYGAIGFYMLARPVAGLASLTLAIAIYLLFEGGLELALSFQLRPAPGSGWLLVDGIITLVLAVMIWGTWPSSAVWVVGTLVGISMFFSGITRLMLSMAVRRIAA
ncbi:MAG TPA: DUF308 domain-containing protein [Vicinamibacterales bacterium]|jgi:uncharacterized membrane protein HdeD (DUF308 family)|nr:DUF308 domain-containing protein [Vicinamibacterales bacterium]